MPKLSHFLRSKRLVASGGVFQIRNLPRLLYIELTQFETAPSDAFRTVLDWPTSVPAKLEPGISQAAGG